jgi:hypothetical protein
MRTFSKLRALCAFPETLPDRPSKRRDDAAETGRLFHRYVETWVNDLDGTLRCDDAPGPVRTWLRKLENAWAPREGTECEVALGLAPDLSFVPVVEDPPGSHVYVPTEEGRPLLTAGRADLLWIADDCLHVCDIKTGQFYLGDPSKLRQLQGQGLAAAARAGMSRLRVGVYYARLGMFDWSPIAAEGDALWVQWQREVVEAATMPPAPRPGPWCLSCWSRKDCPNNPEA